MKNVFISAIAMTVLATSVFAEDKAPDAADHATASAAIATQEAAFEAKGDVVTEQDQLDINESFNVIDEALLTEAFKTGS